MKKILIAGLCILGFVLWLTIPIFPAVTATEETIKTRDRFQEATVKKITFVWTSDALGATTGATTAYFSGIVYRTVFAPTLSATPSALYDVTVTDDDSVDILDGGGANLSSIATVQLQGLLGVSAIADTQLILNVSNAGSGKSGQVIIYIR